MTPAVAPEEFIAAVRVASIGPGRRTTSRMRALGWPDASPNDVAVLKAAAPVWHEINAKRRRAPRPGGRGAYAVLRCLVEQLETFAMSQLADTLNAACTAQTIIDIALGRGLRAHGAWPRRPVVRRPAPSGRTRCRSGSGLMRCCARRSPTALFRRHAGIALRPTTGPAGHALPASRCGAAAAHPERAHLQLMASWRAASARRRRCARWAAAIGRNPASLVSALPPRAGADGALTGLCRRRGPQAQLRWRLERTRMKTSDLAELVALARSGAPPSLHAPGRRRVRPWRRWPPCGVGGAALRADAAAALARPDGRAAPPLARDRRRRRHQPRPCLLLLQLRRVGYQRRVVVDLQRLGAAVGALVAWCWLRERPDAGAALRLAIGFAGVVGPRLAKASFSWAVQAGPYVACLAAALSTASRPTSPRSACRAWRRWRWPRAAS